MYVAQARFVLARPPASLDLARFATLPFVEQIDPAIKHRLITPADLVRPKEPKTVHSIRTRSGTGAKERTTRSACVPPTSWKGGSPPASRSPTRSGKAPRRSPIRSNSTASWQRCRRRRSPRPGLTQLTGLDTPSAGAIEQSIFYVNEVMQFGKLVAVFQQHPADANKTIATVFIALAIESNILGKRKEFGQVPILRNMVPAQVLAGKSSFNSGNSLSAGLPVYARNQVKAIAALLERKYVAPARPA